MTERIRLVVDGKSAEIDADPTMPLLYAPEHIDIVLINRPEIASSGAGEPSTRTVPAAIANAIFDATGLRMRRVPITPERMKAALARA